MLLTIGSVVVVVDSEDFCYEYVKNGHKIDFSFRLYEYNSNFDKEFQKYFFIGDKYWKLSYNDGSKADRNVTIDRESAGYSNWLSGEKYSMVWYVYYKADYKKDYCRVGALQKNLKAIDWAVLYADTLNYKQLFNTTNITFAANFRPILAWLSIPYQVMYRVITFMSDSGSTKSYNFNDPNKPNEDISMISQYQRPILEGKQEQEVYKNYPLMAIIGQYSYNDCGCSDGNCCSTKVDGQGSIVFMNVNKTIQYCYVGIPQSECKPKTLIDCSDTTLTTTGGPLSGKSKLIITLVLVIIGIVLFVLIVAIICCLRYHGLSGNNGSSVSLSKQSGIKSSQSKKSKKSKKKTMSSPSTTGSSSKTGDQSKQTISKTVSKTPSKGGISGHFGPWGRNNWKQLGRHISDKYSKPEIITFLSDKCIIDITCGSHHSLALTSDGTVYGWGLSRYGQCGCGQLITYIKRYNEWGILGLGHNIGVNEPQVIPELCNKMVNKFSIGNEFGLCITSDKQIYSWGLKTKKQLGRHTNDEYSKPEIITFLSDKCIIDITCGYNHSLALTSDGFVYGWGHNSRGQCGCGQQTEYILSPTRVKFPTNTIIKSICFQLVFICHNK
ncbi:uncharacterized protein LOC128952739 [Oppia nitens]|uniref:uncharacterized protein LOC128952739 n=1 Tax=Oppia nitens TaxID=1686743 RepID=UPI0023DA2A69|nr:uncharacterized protein LOC128952739 [Oppia nitens]